MVWRGGKPSDGPQSARPRREALLRGFAGLREQGKAESFALREVGLGHGARQRADAHDVALAFGDADCAAGVEHVEGVRGLDDEVVRGEDQLLRAGLRRG